MSPSAWHKMRALLRGGGHPRAVGSLCLALAALPSCTASARESGAECVFNDDCRGGLVCAGRRCRAACRTPRDCPAGTRCTGGNDGLRACVPDEEPGYCRLSSECAEGESCHSGHCLRGCRGATDCVSGQACNLGRCVPAWLVPLDAGAAPTDVPADLASATDQAVLPADVSSDAAPPDAPFDVALDVAQDASSDIAGDLAGDLATDLPGDLPADLGVDASTPSDASADGGVEPRIVEICANGDRTCARSDAGRVWCWGSNARGGLAAPSSVASSPTPREVVEARGATLLACGGAFYVNSSTSAGHVCVRTADGRALCWGEDRFGQANGPTGGFVAVPAARSFAEPVGALFLGPASTHVVTEGGALWSYGLDDAALLLSGNGTTSTVATPQRALLRDAVLRVTVGSRHACAQSAGGRLYCAGEGNFGEFGVGFRTDATVPIEVVAARPFARDIVSMVAGMRGSLLAGGFTCAATRDGVTRCTGSLPFLPAMTYGFTPVEALRGALRLYNNAYVNTRGSSLCALRDDLTARCLNVRGDGAATELPFANVHDLALGSGHFCALHADGAVSCVGSNDLGQLGDGTTAASTAPRRVRFAR